MPAIEFSVLSKTYTIVNPTLFYRWRLTNEEVFFIEAHNKPNIKIILELFLVFAKIGALTFGGGYSMLPLLQREVVEIKKWIDTDELANYFALSQCMPGIIAVNVATFIGTKLAGTAGGVVATLGIISPSVAIILMVSIFMRFIETLEIVKNIFSGIRISVSALILSSVIRLVFSGVDSKLGVFIFISAMLFTVLTSISPILIIIIAVAISIIYVKSGASRL